MSSISERTLKLWANFPPNVRDDLCFKAFRDEYGKSVWSARTASCDQSCHVLFSPSDFETVPANRTLLGGRERPTVPKKRFNWQNVMYGMFFVLWLFSFWYYVTVREHVPQVKLLSIDSTAAKCENADHRQCHSEMRNFV